MQKESRAGSWKSFLLTLAATTFSIVLTFGTSAIVDRTKQNAEKREMVMMILYDMRESLDKIEAAHQELQQFFDVQVDVVAHPEKLPGSYLDLAMHVPTLHYTTTTESIFRNNVETIQTIGNILFVQTVSFFYDIRADYKKEVVDQIMGQMDGLIVVYEKLRDFNSPSLLFSGEAYLRAMQNDFEQCKSLMKVSDQDLDKFSLKQKKLLEDTGRNVLDEVSASSQQRQQRQEQLEQACEEGKKAKSKMK